MNIRKMHREFGYGYLGELLPPFFFEIDVLGLKAHEWTGLLIFGLFAYFIALMFVRFISLIGRLLKREALNHFLLKVSAPIKLLLWVWISRQLLQLLPLSATLQIIMETDTFWILAMIWTAMRISDFAFDRWKVQSALKGQAGAPALLSLGNRVIKLLLIIIGATIWLDNIGFKVTTILTGLGVGGIAVALASQKSIEDIFSTVSIFTARPVRIGDFVRYGDKLGTIEEIGLRWTRIRTLERTLVNIPNAQFAGLHLENLSAREKMLYRTRLSLRYETSANQLRYVLAEMRRTLKDHPKVDPDPARIRFTEFGDYALMLDIFVYIKTADYNEYLAIAEEINLKLMDIVLHSGTGFAFPSQTLYMGKDTGLDPELVRKAEGTVQKWREEGKL